VLGLDNFNDYYPVALKRARQVRPSLAVDTLTLTMTITLSPTLTLIQSRSQLIPCADVRRSC